MYLYAPLLAVAAFLASGTTSLARRAALRWKIVDTPDGVRKHHAAITPLLGGAGVFAALGLILAPLLLGATLGFGPAADAPGAIPLLLGLMLSGLGFFLVGLCDDAWNLRPFDKLLGQFAAVLPYLLCDRTIEVVQLMGGPVNAGPLGAVLTLVWLLLCVNALNLLDGHDGVAATVGLVLCVGAAVLAEMQGNTVAAIVALAAAGALAGFLRYNWPPAKIFLGDAGSLPLGFLIGALTIEVAVKRAVGLSLAVPLVLMMIPSFDTGMAILRRVLSGRSVMQGDLGHLHHCLVRLGLRGGQVPLAIGALCLATGISVIVAQWWGSDLPAYVLGISIIAGLVGAKVFGHGELRMLLARMQIVAPATNRSATARTEPLAPNVDQLWRRLCGMFEQQGGVRLEMVVVSKGAAEPEFHRRWLAANTASAVRNESDWEVSIRRGAYELRIEATWRRRAMRNGTPHDDRHNLLWNALRHWPLPGEGAAQDQPRRAA